MNLFLRCLFLFCMVQLCRPLYGQTDSLRYYMKQGEELYYKGSYDNSIAAFSRGAVLAKESKDTAMLCKALNNLGNCYSHTGNLQASLANYQGAQKIAERSKDTLTFAKCLKNIGTIYSESGDFIKALSYYEKAEALALHLSNQSLVADCYNNRAVIYEQQKLYEKARSFYSKALAIYEKEKNQDRMAMGYNNLGIVYKYLKNYDQSARYYRKTYDIAAAIHDSALLIACLTNTGIVSGLQGRHTRAVELLEQSIAMAEKTHESLYLIETLDALADEYKRSGDFRKAYEYRILYEKEKFSYINDERTQQMADMETKYETKKKENEIASLKQAAEIRTLKMKEQEFSIQRRNYALAGGAVILLLLLSSFYFYIQAQKARTARRQEMVIHETEEAERSRIAKDIHDDLGSGLSKIRYLSELLLAQSNGSEAKNSLRAISDTSNYLVENMRDLIWALNPENTTLGSLVSRIREYASDYLNDFPIELSVQIPHMLPETRIRKEAHRNIFFIVKESLQNLVKHADATQAGISVTINRRDMQIIITDNGIGIANDNTGKGNGLRNIGQRADVIGAQVYFLSNENEGLKTVINIPLNNIFT